jgi:hypothetical protein
MASWLYVSVRSALAADFRLMQFVRVKFCNEIYIAFPENATQKVPS